MCLNLVYEPIETEFKVANYSGTDNALFAAIREASAKYFPGAPVVPHLTSWYTENQRCRPLGIVAYGFNPYTATEEEGNTEHGNDERIRVEEVRRGPRGLFGVVGAVGGGGVRIIQMPPANGCRPGISQQLPQGSS